MPIGNKLGSENRLCINAFVGIKVKAPEAEISNNPEIQNVT